MSGGFGLKRFVAGAKNSSLRDRMRGLRGVEMRSFGGRGGG